MELTDEQRRIVASRATRLAVQAGAGAAKTTTLCAYAHARPQSRILYLAFNKAIQLEAAAKMPSNVTCRTTHSIAWRKAIELFGDQTGQRVGNTYPSTVAKAFGCSALAATGALQTIQRWCGSLETLIDVEHLPLEIAARLADPNALVTLAREVWRSMVDGSERDIRMPHGGYLKLFQMDRPVLRGFPIVAVDESQDLNLCTFDIVRRQSAAVLMVGDSHQCLPGGTRVTLADGRIVPIEGIERGAIVRTAMGAGRFGSSPVTDIFSTRRTGRVVRIRLESGREIVSTPEHTHFADFKEGSGIYLGLRVPHMVYLMQRGEKFRVGTTRMYASNHLARDSQFGIRVRVSQEQADAGWMISAHATELGARVEEAVVAANYGIPTIVFCKRLKGVPYQGPVSSDAAIEEIFRRVPSHRGAHRLLAEQGLQLEAPHFLTKCQAKGRRNIGITLCGGWSGTRPLHRLEVSGSEHEDAIALESEGFSVRPANRARGWKIERFLAHFGTLTEIADQVSEVLGGARVVRKISAGAGITLRFMPAASVRPGMVMLNDEGQLDLVEEVEFTDSEVDVYDLNVERTHNFVANGIVTHNSIYGFRGSVNALNGFEATKYHLTRSFRFGRGIASLANALLGAFKEDFAQPLVGVGQPQQTRFSVDTKKAFAVIARTNAVIFEEAVAFLPLNRRYHFVGGTDGYKLEKILDAYYLSTGDRGLMRDPYLRSFESIEALAALAEEAEDPELKHLVRVILAYGHRVPELVDEIKARHVDLPKDSWHQFDGLFFSTAHKSKGLEFEQVWLADDFMRFFEDGRELEPDEVSQEEVNILYVALTRTRAAIKLSESFEEWLLHKRLMPN